MLQLKYFGDSRDYFKYDLITSVLKELPVSNYVFVPMLTEARDDKQGNKKIPSDSGGKSPKLLSFIQKCLQSSEGKSLRNWETWLSCYVNSYNTVEPVDETYFDSASRPKYWERFGPLLCIGNALIFIDPDTGLETGKPSYLIKMGKQKYLLNYELEKLILTLAPASALMVYQHLPYNKHIHEKAVEMKLNQVRAFSMRPFVCGYREGDLSFIFISKTRSLYKEIVNVLNDYYSKSIVRYRSIHG